MSITRGTTDVARATAHVGSHLRRCFSNFFDLVAILTLSWLILAFKTPPRTSKTPPRRPQDPPRRPQEPPRRPRHPLQEAQTHCFSSCFSMFSLSRAILTQRGLQDDFKSLQDAFKTPSRASKTPPRASKTDAQVSKTPPKASKTSPRPSKIGPRDLPRAPKIKKIALFNNFFAFLGLFGAI